MLEYQQLGTIQKKDTLNGPQRQKIATLKFTNILLHF